MNDVMWTVESEVDVPMVVLAEDWRTALCMGLQLLELEDGLRTSHCRGSTVASWLRTPAMEPCWSFGTSTRWPWLPDRARPAPGQ